MDNQTLSTIGNEFNGKTSHLKAWLDTSVKARLITLIDSDTLTITKDGANEVIDSIRNFTGSDSRRTAFKRGITRAYYSLTGCTLALTVSKNTASLTKQTVGDQHTVNEHGERKMKPTEKTASSVTVDSEDTTTTENVVKEKDDTPKVDASLLTAEKAMREDLAKELNEARRELVAMKARADYFQTLITTKANLDLAANYK